MAIEKDLLEILRCPETQQTLTLADAARVAELNERIAAGTLRNRGGEPVDEPIDGALIRADGQFAYLIRDEIPEMLIAAAVPLD